MRRRAEGLGIEIAAEYGPALAAADLVHSVVTCDRAGVAAGQAAPFLKQGAVFLDHNTVTRKMAEDNARVVEAAGADYIDVAVMGGFLAYGYKAPMTIAGRRAEEVGAWMRAVGYDVTVMPGPAGVASAVKILRSIMMKGIEALGVEFLVAARRQGLLEEALACTADVDKAPFRDFIAMLVTTHIAHAKRRHEETVLVNDMLRESGIEPLMSLATERSHFRSIATGAVRPEDPVPDLETALDILTREAVRPFPR
jgi:3-hydroxyisobutyrate dehydrogenase-like beta-hydroxyacid dehydrogenase